MTIRYISDPPVHILACDRPDCTAHIVLPDQRNGARIARDQAELAGWQIASLDVDVDLCAEHVDLTRPVKITPLYDEFGRPLAKHAPTPPRRRA